MSEETLSAKFVGVNVDKLSGELFDILCTVCKSEALSIVRSEEGMQGFQTWHKLHLSYNPRTMARAMMTMVEAVCPPKISHLTNFEVSVRAWEEKLRVLERGVEERVSSKLRMAILTSTLPPNLQD